MLSEDGMEWIEDAESEEPRRIVEDGYIFYDMGEFLFSVFYFPSLADLLSLYRIKDEKKTLFL
jgi:hypothetical protein